MYMCSAKHSASLSLVLYSLYPLPAPSQVTGVSLFKAVRHGKPSLRVNWTVPQSDVNISKYQVQYKRYGDTFWGGQVDTIPPTTSTLLPSLDAGTEYQVRVRAKAGGTSGMWSVEKNERTFDSEYPASIISFIANILCRIHM